MPVPVEVVQESSHPVLLPALAGLLGTIAGVLANGLSAKWSDDRKLRQERQRAQDQYDHQANILRAVLRSELSSMVNTFTEEAAFAENSGNVSTYVPTIGYLGSIRKDLSVLGLLLPSEAEAIMCAYYSYQEHTWYIRNNAAKTTQGPVAPVDEPVTYDLTVGDYRMSLVNDLRAIVGVAQKAVDAIQLTGDAAGVASSSDLLRKLIQGVEPLQAARFR